MMAKWWEDIAATTLNPAGSLGLGFIQEGIDPTLQNSYGGDLYRGGKDALRDVPIIGNALGLTGSQEQASNALQQGLARARGEVEGGYQRAGEYYDPYVSMAEGLPGLQQRVQGGEFQGQSTMYQQPGMERFTADEFNYKQSPGYQFAMDEALGQTQRGLSARGLAGSGAEKKAMMRMAQGLASQDYGNQFNRYMQGRQQDFGEFQGMQNQRMGLAQMGQRAHEHHQGAQNQILQQQLQNELAMGNIGLGATDKRADLERSLSELLAQLEVGGAQGLAASKMARANATQDFLSEGMGLAGNIATMGASGTAQGMAPGANSLNPNALQYT